MKVELLDPVDLRVLPDDKWMTLNVVRFKLISNDGTYQLILIQPGFIYDGASVPRFPGMYLFFGGKARIAALLHDYLYSIGYPRKSSDEWFRVAMRAEEPGWRRAIMWAGVRLGGWTSYKDPSDVPPPVDP